MELKHVLTIGIIALAMSGCATDKEALTSLETTANEAKSSAADANSAAADAKTTATGALDAARSAQSSADSAMSTATEALEKARLALEKSERNEAAIMEINEKIDRMFKKTMHK